MVDFVYYRDLDQEATLNEDNPSPLIDQSSFFNIIIMTGEGAIPASRTALQTPKSIRI
jgi:hypothetical protein